EDCNSTNGTTVDGKILSPGEKVKLRQGAHVTFGKAVYIFR
nr:FHA domain-containing protein [Eubacterium sp.]